MQPLSCHALTRVVIADDHAVVRAGIKAVLEGLDEVAVVGEARDGAELVQQVDRLLPDVALADISMPGMDGISAVAAIHRTHPSVRLIMLSMVDDTDSVRQAVAAGATGYLVKDSPSFEIDHALRNACAERPYFSSRIAAALLREATGAQDELTPRQLEILKMVASGLHSKAIGWALGLSAKTVDVHRSRIMDRLGIYDVATLTRYALRRKLLEA